MEGESVEQPGSRLDGEVGTALGEHPEEELDRSAARGREGVAELGGRRIPRRGGGQLDAGQEDVALVVGALDGPIGEGAHRLLTTPRCDELGDRSGRRRWVPVLVAVEAAGDIVGASADAVDVGVAEAVTPGPHRSLAVAGHAALVTVGDIGAVGGRRQLGHRGGRVVTPPQPSDRANSGNDVVGSAARSS